MGSGYRWLVGIATFLVTWAICENTTSWPTLGIILFSVAVALVVSFIDVILVAVFDGLADVFASW